MNFRLAILIAIGPSSGVTRPGTIARPNRQVFGPLHSPIMLRCMSPLWPKADIPAASRRTVTALLHWH
jgi:hypothetical protein